MIPIFSELLSVPAKMRITWMFIFLFISGIVLADSQNPAPTPPNATAQPKQDTKNNNTEPNDNAPSSKSPSAAVETTQARIIYIESDQKPKDACGYFSPEWLTFYATGVLAAITFFLAYYTGGLYRATVALSKQAKSDGEEQSNRMFDAIVQATRAANSIGNLADSSRKSANAAIKAAEASERAIEITEETAKRELRAYLTVRIGGGDQQDRHKRQFFAVRPQIINSGKTPAYEMNWWAKADILPVPLPDDFNFPSQSDTETHSLTIGPGQDLYLLAIHPRYVPDSEAREIIVGNDKRVYVWGEITYVDAFGESRSTKFCHNIFWLNGTGQLQGQYTPCHNDAT